MTKAAFRKSDVDRAIAVVKAAGFTIAAVDIGPDGRIRIITAEGAALTEMGGEETLDRELAAYRGKHGHGRA